MAVPAFSSIPRTVGGTNDAQASRWPNAAGTDRRSPVRLAGIRQGKAARAWVYFLCLPEGLEIYALACAYFIGPDGYLTASRATIGAVVRRKLGKVGRTARQVQRALALLIKAGVLIERGWHVHGYRKDGRPIRTRRYFMPVGTPADMLIPATPLTEVRTAFRRAIVANAAACEAGQAEAPAPKCHSVDPPEPAASPPVESDISAGRKGHLEAEMSHNPKDRLDSENQSPTGAAREAEEPPPRAPIEYNGADPLNSLYARHGIDVREPPTIPPTGPAPSPPASSDAAAPELARGRESRLLGLFDQTYLDRLKKDHARLKNRGRP